MSNLRTITELPAARRRSLEARVDALDTPSIATLSADEVKALGYQAGHEAFMETLGAGVPVSLIHDGEIETLAPSAEITGK